MNKRPLWTAFLLWIVFLFITGNSGSMENDPLFSWIKAGTDIKLEGQIYRQESKEKTILLYLNQVKIKSNHDFKFPKNVIISIKEKKKWTTGMTIIASGTVQEMEQASNWGGFDPGSYYEQQGVGLFLQNGVVEKEIKSANRYLSFLDKIRERLKESVENISSEEDSAILKAMLLGEKEDLKKEQKELYQKGGISHILAISGLHISFLGLLLYQFLRKRALSFGASGFLSAVVMGSYGVMTGMSVSAMRAVLMFFIYLGSQILGRTYDVLSSLSFAGLIVLLYNPASVHQASFQLSFGAVLGLTLLLPKMEEAFQKEKERAAIKIFRASVSVSIATLPISLFFFSEWSVFGILLNILVIPTVQIVLLSGGAAMIAGLFFPNIGIILQAPAHYLLMVYEKLSGFAAEIPGAVWRAGSPDQTKIILYYVLLAFLIFLTQYAKKRWKKWIWIVGIFFMFLIMEKRLPDKLFITVLDVGQGDGICIQNGKDGCYMMDGGSTSQTGVGEFCIESYLKFEGVSRIDGWFLSHADLDHISGLLEILQSYRCTWDGRNAEGITIEKIFLPYRREKAEWYQQIEKLARQNKIEIYYMEKGQKVTEKEMEIVCLAPDRKCLSGEENSDSMVLSVKYGDFTALLTGDLEGDGEEILIKSGILKEIDFLKVAHHGSEFSTTEEFLRQTKPKLAVISCAEKNRYGHPHEKLLFRLKKSGTVIKMTKESGAVKVITDGKKYIVKEKKRHFYGNKFFKLIGKR
ncbi:MAG: DNA internalization-related competence protein ComEC/Rec2 [Eubacteriales bacterium]|nr:DNA internalization-related competence protein ComEC/Rec2 [Eubacteriales bacterium]